MGVLITCVILSSNNGRTAALVPSVLASRVLVLFSTRIGNVSGCKFQSQKWLALLRLQWPRLSPVSDAMRNQIISVASAGGAWAHCRRRLKQFVSGQILNGRLVFFSPKIQHHRPFNTEL
jgi:hypothetical protein